MPNKKINWGIVGTGYICGKFCSALSQLADARIEAVCSRDEGRGKDFAKRFGCKKVFTDIDAMCTDENIDIIYIGTPHSGHPDAIFAALNAGKNVLCEKPMTVNAKIAARAAALAKEKGCFLMSGMWTQFLPAVTTAVNWINEGQIGKVREIECTFHIDRADEPAESRLINPALGGGSLLDVGVYPLLCAHMFFDGKPEISYTDMTPASTGVDLAGRVMLTYPDGGKAYLSFGFDFQSSSASIKGDKGYIVVPDWCFAHSAYLYKDGQLAESFCQPMENGMEYEAMHVIECLRNGFTESPRYPLSSTLSILGLCDDIRKQWGITYPCDNYREKRSSNGEAAITEKPLSDVPDWYRDAVIYHIYPIGMCGAPRENDFSSQPSDAISKIADIIPHISRTGFNCIYFGPVFESTRHGYDTADYSLIDRRLGTNADFAELCQKLHTAGIRVILDGVFNHVGRDFFAFRDVLSNREGSRYSGWFNINFGGNSPYNDGLWYEGWEGHYDLVKLNLRNPEVKQYIFDRIRGWIDEFGIDGLRLDVAYCLDLDFLRELKSFCRSVKGDFFLLGEVVHGDYNRWCNDQMTDSVTNYECYKGVHSSINCANMHEIAYSLNRQFGREHWCLYTGKSLYNFVDNHDVSRIASILNDKELLPCAYSLMFSMPGIPSVYYGSELEFAGDKKDGDDRLRPALTAADVEAYGGSLAEHIASLCAAREQSAALCRGSYAQLYVAPKQLVFEREYNGERVICAINTDSAPHTAHFNANAGRAKDLISGIDIDFGGGLDIPAKSAIIARVF